MGQHRTKKEKERAQQIRLKEIERESTVPIDEGSYRYVSTVSPSAKADTLLKVDSKYILRDLIKTVTISCFLLCVVIGIYFYLRYN